MADSTWIHTALSRYETQLVRYAENILGNREAAREVVQDTFLRLCKENPKRVEGHLAQWLFTVCRNRALDLKRKTRQLKPLDEDNIQTLAAPGQSPLGILEKKETLAEILRMLEELPEQQQEVIRLNFQHELSYKEIAATMNLSISNVGFLIHNGVRTIRQRIADQAGDRPQPIRRIK